MKQVNTTNIVGFVVFLFEIIRDRFRLSFLEIGRTFRQDALGSTLDISSQRTICMWLVDLKVELQINIVHNDHGNSTYNDQSPFVGRVERY